MSLVQKTAEKKEKDKKKLGAHNSHGWMAQWRHNSPAKWMLHISLTFFLKCNWEMRCTRGNAVHCQTATYYKRTVSEKILQCYSLMVDGVRNSNDWKIEQFSNTVSHDSDVNLRWRNEMDLWWRMEWNECIQMSVQRMFNLIAWNFDGDLWMCNESSTGISN